MLEALRSGDWVTRDRVRFAAAALLIAFVAGARLPRRHIRRPQRYARAAARHRLFQRLCRRHPGARRRTAGAVRSGAAIRPRAGDLRSGDAVLRLALSAVLPSRRRSACDDAVPARARGVAGREPAALSPRAADDRDECTGGAACRSQQRRPCGKPRIRCGFSWRWRFPRCSSISATATTAFSPRR